MEYTVQVIRINKDPTYFSTAIDNIDSESLSADRDMLKRLKRRVCIEIIKKPAFYLFRPLIQFGNFLGG